MKRFSLIAALFAVVLLVLCLAACGQDNGYITIYRDGGVRADISDASGVLEAPQRSLPPESDEATAPETADEPPASDSLGPGEPAETLEDPAPPESEGTVDRSLPGSGDGDAVVYVTDTGSKYHLDGCGYLNKSRIELTLDEAIERGYTPCSRCFGKQ